MSELSVLECPHCGAPVAFRAENCLYCHAPLTWGEAPALERGRCLMAHRYPAQKLIGAEKLKITKLETRADGIGVEVASNGFVWSIGEDSRRDVCVALGGVALDADVGFGALARAFSQGGIVGGYLAMVLPSYRAVRLARVIEGGTLSVVSPITNWESHAAIGAIGQLNVIELRCADSMLQVLVNGVRVQSVVDAGIGFGAYGWRAISLGELGRVVFQSLEAYEVVSR